MQPLFNEFLKASAFSSIKQAQRNTSHNFIII